MNLTDLMKRLLLKDEAEFWGFYEAAVLPPWSTRYARMKQCARKFLREPKARFIERSSVSFFMHRRCASLKNRQVETCRFFWRREWDSNPRGLSPKRFSRPPRYDRFDISPNIQFVEYYSQSLIYYTPFISVCQGVDWKLYSKYKVKERFLHEKFIDRTFILWYTLLRWFYWKKKIKLT